MLNKRTNILFDEYLWNVLSAYSASSKKSVGELVRHAVKKVYLDNKNDRRVRAFSTIKRLKKGLNSIKSSEIRKLIDYGRK